MVSWYCPNAQKEFGPIGYIALKKGLRRSWSRDSEFQRLCDLVHSFVIFVKFLGVKMSLFIK